MLKRKSVSLVEVLVGAVLLALVFGSLLTVFLAVRNYVRRSNARLVAANLSRRIFIDLYKDVRQDTWDTGGLTIGDYSTISYLPMEIESLQYGDNSDLYKVEAIAGQDYRKVTAKIKYVKE